MSLHRTNLHQLVATLRGRLDALDDDLRTEPFGASYDETVGTQDRLCRWNKKHLIPAMVDLVIAIEDAGCDSVPEHSAVCELSGAIGDKLTDLYHDAHEDVRARAAEARLERRAA